MSAPVDQSKYLNGAPVGPGQAVYLGLRNAFRWRGRASRSAFWWFSLFLVAFDVLSYVIASSTGSRGQSAALLPVLFLVILPACLYTRLAWRALLVRRLHDANRSGWWQLIQLVPFLGPAILLVYLCDVGNPGRNRFGDGPRPAVKLPSYPLGYRADSSARPLASSGRSTG